MERDAERLASWKGIHLPGRKAANTVGNQRTDLKRRPKRVVTRGEHLLGLKWSSVQVYGSTVIMLFCMHGRTANPEHLVEA